MSTGTVCQSSHAHSVSVDRHYKQWTVGLWAGCLAASVAVFLERLAFGSNANVPSLVGCAVSLTVTVLAVFVGAIVNFHDSKRTQAARNFRALLILLPSALVAAAFSGGGWLCDTFLITQFVTGVAALIVFSSEHASTLPESTPATSLRIFKEPDPIEPSQASPAGNVRINHASYNSEPAARTTPLEWPELPARAAGELTGTDIKRDRPLAVADGEFLNIRRTQTASGDRLDGHIRVDFQPGQQRQTVHIPFTPHFSELPTVNCEVKPDGVRTQVADSRRFGARIELKRRNAEVAEVAMLTVSATEPGKSERV